MLAIQIFQEYLRDSSPNKIDVDENILHAIYDKFGCEPDTSTFPAFANAGPAKENQL